MPSPFRPGLSASVDMQTERSAGTVSVPMQAVTIRDESGRSRSTESRPDQPREAADANPKPEAPEKKKEASKVKEVVFVYDKGEGNVSMREVVTVIQDDRYIEMKSGLGEGEEVVVAPFLAISKTLRDGSAVRIVERSELFSRSEEHTSELQSLM